MLNFITVKYSKFYKLLFDDGLYSLLLLIALPMYFFTMDYMLVIFVSMIVWLESSSFLVVQYLPLVLAFIIPFALMSLYFALTLVLTFALYIIITSIYEIINSIAKSIMGSLTNLFKMVKDQRKPSDTLSPEKQALLNDLSDKEELIRVSILSDEEDEFTENIANEYKRFKYLSFPVNNPLTLELERIFEPNGSLNVGSDHPCYELIDPVTMCFIKQPVILVGAKGETRFWEGSTLCRRNAKKLACGGYENPLTRQPYYLRQIQDASELYTQRAKEIIEQEQLTRASSATASTQLSRGFAQTPVVAELNNQQTLNTLNTSREHIISIIRRKYQ